MFNNIAVPNNWPYISDNTKRGPGSVWLDPTRPDFAYACNASNGTVPYATLTAVINGVDYMIDSANNLVHTPSPNPGLCNIGFQNASAGDTSMTLGLTFLRSVYVYVSSSRYWIVSWLNPYFRVKCIPFSNRYLSRLLRICLPVRGKSHGCPEGTKTHINAQLELTMSTIHCTDIDAYSLFWLCAI